MNAQTLERLKDLLSDSLSLCLEYRNLAAHGGRIYNYVPQSIVRDVGTDTLTIGLGLLVQVLSFFEYKQPHIILRKAINQAVSDYCNTYPNDIQRLENAIGLTIHQQKFFWLNEKSLIYHENPSCSGSMNNKKLRDTQIDVERMRPCHKCCQH